MPRNVAIAVLAALLAAVPSVSSAQLPLLTTTTSTSTTTTASTTTTTTTAPEATPSTTSTTEADETTTTTSTSTSTSTTSTSEPEALDLDLGDEGSFSSLASDSLSISAPSSVDLSSVADMNGFSSLLGAVTVTIEGSLDPVESWTATVTATDFVSGGGGPGRTIPNENLAYWSGSSLLSILWATPGQETAAEAESLDASVIAFSGGGGVLDRSVTWTPTLVVVPPADTLGGDYEGTIVHSVA
ncbi:MAG TPA: hypothetical protein VEA78_02135 [Acidimicrobiales bacterium]|nr:hypothetical protein [Acidimicrobiales bacterium]